MCCAHVDCNNFYRRYSTRIEETPKLLKANESSINISYCTLGFHKVFFRSLKSCIIPLSIQLRSCASPKEPRNFDWPQRAHFSINLGTYYTLNNCDYNIT